MQCPFSPQMSREALESVISRRTEELRNMPAITAAGLLLSPAADRLHQIVKSQDTLNHVR